jgi:hypothetical protein
MMSLAFLCLKINPLGQTDLSECLLAYCWEI